MKHAILIYAHNEPTVLATLLHLLDHPRVDLFLHIDARNPDLRSAAAVTLRSAQLHWVTPSEVAWGDYSQVAVELRLFEAARQHGNYAHYHLLSGVDLPIKPIDEILRFFDAHPNREFLGFWETPDHLRDVERRTQHYYLFTRYLKRRPYRWRHRLTVPIRNLSLVAQKVVHYRRYAQRQFYKGFNWCSLTQACVDYLLAERTQIRRTYRHMLAPDEIYKQTLIAQSPFADRLFDRADPERGTMRRIDWERGCPYIWQADDLPELLASPYLFARKMSAECALALAQHFSTAH